MGSDYDIGVYMRFIQLEVIIPKEFVWEFMQEFGTEFAVNDLHAGPVFKAVDRYMEHPNGWHIGVTVWENDEPRFNHFLRSFCEARSLRFKEAD